METPEEAEFIRKLEKVEEQLTSEWREKSQVTLELARRLQYAETQIECMRRTIRRLENQDIDKDI